MHCKIFSSILDSYSPDASSIPTQSYNKQKCLKTLPNTPWGKIHPQLRTNALHHLSPCYICDLVSLTFSSLIPPSYSSLLAIPARCPFPRML